MLPKGYARITASELSNDSEVWLLSKSTNKQVPIALGPFRFVKFRCDGYQMVGFPPELVYVGYPAGYEPASKLEYDTEWVAGLMIAGKFREVSPEQLIVPVKRAAKLPKSKKGWVAEKVKDDAGNEKIVMVRRNTLKRKHADVPFREQDSSKKAREQRKVAQKMRDYLEARKKSK